MEILKKSLIFFLCCMIACSIPTYAEKEQSTEGHFTLPTSQEPGPLFGFEFGQNIVDKGDMLLYLYPSYAQGSSRKNSTIDLDFLYGIRDDFSLFLQLETFPQLRNGCCSSSGVGDIMVQLEYAWYEKDTYTSSNQATVIGNITLPSGSAKKNPPTGTGSPTFYFGFSASHTSPSWYVWINPGIIVNTPYQGSRTGNQFPYQFGIARNIAYALDRWILSILLEFNGEYRQKSTTATPFITTNTDAQSIFSAGPSLWFSTQRFTLQAGISFPIHQCPRIPRSTTPFITALNLGWKFN